MKLLTFAIEYDKHPEEYQGNTNLHVLSHIFHRHHHRNISNANKKLFCCNFSFSCKINAILYNFVLHWTTCVNLVDYFSN